MAGKDTSTKDKEMAAHLKKMGYPHGRRFTRPFPNSGGLTQVKRPGSANFHRYMKK